MVYIVIKDLSGIAEDTIMITSSISKKGQLNHTSDFLSSEGLHNHIRRDIQTQRDPCSL